jgi:hypothetical protein
MNAQDYQRFHNFLAAHECKVDYREFRTGDAARNRSAGGSCRSWTAGPGGHSGDAATGRLSRRIPALFCSPRLFARSADPRCYQLPQLIQPVPLARMSAGRFRAAGLRDIGVFPEASLVRGRAQAEARTLPRRQLQCSTVATGFEGRR